MDRNSSAVFGHRMLRDVADLGQSSRAPGESLGRVGVVAGVVSNGLLGIRPSVAVLSVGHERVDDRVHAGRLDERITSLGRSAGPWRVAEARNHRFRTHRVPVSDKNVDQTGNANLARQSAKWKRLSLKPVTRPSLRCACVLVQLRRVHPDALSEPLCGAWRFVSATADRRRQTQRRTRPRLS